MTDPGARVRQLADGLAAARLRLEALDAATVADQIAIAEIPAPTFGEARRATWMARRLTRAGLADVRIDEAGNVIGLCPGAKNGRPVVVCAHLDTVFDSHDTIAVQREGRRLSAPGIGDNARGLATMLALASQFTTRHFRPVRPVLFAATTGEEGLGDLRGARHLFETVARDAHVAIAIDGPGDERVVASALGCRRYRVTFRGPGGHSWAAFGAPNAVHAAASLAARLAALPLPTRPRTTLTTARIGGGTAVNAIPAEAWLEIDLRSTSGTELTRLDAVVRAAASDAANDENARRRSGTAPLSVSLVTVSERPAGEVPATEPVVAAALEATRCMGRFPELAVASTDANVPISRGIPAIAIGGGGRGGDTHTPHEWFENQDGPRGIMRALLVVAAMAGIQD